MAFPQTGDLLFIGLAGLMLLVVITLWRRAKRLADVRRGPPGTEEFTYHQDGGDGGPGH